MVTIGNWKKDIYHFARNADMLSLLAMGCPVNEYDIEVDLIIPRLDVERPTSYQEVWQIVTDVFTAMFEGTYWPCHKQREFVDSICSRLGIVC